MALDQFKRGRIIQLMNEGKSQREIARVLNIPKSTVHDAMKALKTQPVEERQSSGYRGLGYPPLMELESSVDELKEMIVWWRQRTAQRATDHTTRETSRQTYHVNIRYINLVRQEADEEGISLKDVVDRVFRHYFDGKTT